MGYADLVERGAVKAPTQTTINPALLSRLDSGTQIGLTGSYSTTNNKGNTVTAAPVSVGAGNTPGGFAAGQAALNDQQVYGATLAAQNAGLGISGMTNAAVGAGAQQGTVTGPQNSLSQLIQQGAQIVGGYVIDPATGLAAGRAPTTTGGGYSTPSGGAAPGGGGGGGTGGGTLAPTGGGIDPGIAPESGSLQEVSKEAIDAQINALTSQYGLDLASLAALGGEIGAQAQFLMAQLGRDQGFASEDLNTDLVQRGVFRSGIAARDHGRLQGDFAAQRAQVEMDKGSRLRQLAERAGAASAALGRGKADVIGNIDRGNLNAELRQSLLNELNSLTPADINAALQAAYSGNQQSLSQLIDSGGQRVGLDFAGGAQQAQSYAPDGSVRPVQDAQGNGYLDPDDLLKLLGGTSGSGAAPSSGSGVSVSGF